MCFRRQGLSYLFGHNVEQLEISRKPEILSCHLSVIFDPYTPRANKP